jgi:opacity protein-like surface antigen
MKKIIFAGAVAALSTIAIGAQAQEKSGFYTEFGVMQAYYKEPTANFNNAMAAITLGYSINKNIAVEVMGATSIGEANFNIGSTRINAKTSGATGAYVKGSLPVDNSFEVFAKAGVTNGKVEASSAYGSAWSSGSSFSYGAGMQFNFTKDVYATAQYMSYYDRKGISITGPSVSVGYKF